jgi:regulator of replication initiation timing
MAQGGLDKLAALEDKIFRHVEMCKVLRQEKADLLLEVERIKQDVTALKDENSFLEKKLLKLVADREELKLKVEAMIDAIAMLELEAESLKK